MQPSKILNFADSLKLDSTVVFSRTASTNTHPGTYFDSNGVMQESKYDTPRFHFNPVTGVSRGLMIEEARKNQLIYSGDFNNAAWGVYAPMAKTGITRAGLGGDMTGYTFTTSGSGGSFYQHVIAGGTTYQGASIFVHTSSTCTDATILAYWFTGGATQSVVLRFYPQSGTVHSTAANSASLSEWDIIDCGNGWFRYTISGKGSDAANTLIRFQVYSNQGTSCTLVVDKAQLDNEETCSSYIPTGAVALTRPKDYCYDTSDFLDFFNFQEGTIVVEYERFSKVNQAARGAPIYTLVLGIGSWTTGRYLIADYGTAIDVSTCINSAIPYQYSITGSASNNANTVKTVVLAYKKNDFISACNGVLFGASASQSLPQTLTSNHMWIGSEGADSQMNGCIRKIMIFPARLPNQRVYEISLSEPETVKPSFVLSFLNEQIPAFVKFANNTGGTRRKSNGLLETVGVDKGRIDWNGAKCLGLLQEKYSVNMLPYSDLSTGWGIVNFTEGKNTTDVKDPRGGNTATKLTAIATGVSAFYRTSTTLTVSAIYTISGHFKRGTAGYFLIGFSDNIDSGWTATVSSTTLAVTSGGFGGWTNGTVIVETMVDGWYRIILTATNNSSDTLTCGYLMHSNGSLSNNNTAGEYGYIWGPQMEPGNIATSSIPNSSGGAVSRGQDVFWITNSNKLTYPGDPTHASYTKTECTIGGTTIGMPFGNIGENLGFKLIESTNNSYKSIFKWSSGLKKTSVTVSSWMVKKAERRFIYLEAYISPNRAYIAFDFDTHQFTNNFVSGTGVVAISTKAYPYPDGWFKIVRVINHGAAGVVGATVTNIISLTDASGTSLFTGDGTSGVYIGSFQCYELTDGLTMNEPFYDTGSGVIESSEATSMAWFNPVEGVITKESYHTYPNNLITAGPQELGQLLFDSGRAGFYTLRDVGDVSAPYHDAYAYAGSPTKTALFDIGGTLSITGRSLTQSVSYASGAFHHSTDANLETFATVPTSMAYVSRIFSRLPGHNHLQRITYTPRRRASRVAMSQLIQQNDFTVPSLNLQFAKAKSVPGNITFSRNDSVTCATKVGANGKIETVLANVPRITHDTTGKCLGLMVEEARTQLAPYTDLFTAGYGVLDVAIGSVSTLDPSGNVTNVTKITELATTNQHLINRDIGTRVVGDKVTIYCLAKAGERTQLTLTSNAEGYSVFNLDTGTIYSTGGNVCYMTPWYNGWYLCIATITKTNTNGTMWAGIWSGNAPSYLGVVNSGLYIWDFQIEIGAMATSYMYNNTAGTVARQTDNVTISGSNFISFINKTEGTIVARVLVKYPDITASKWPTVFCLSDGTENNRINCYYYTSGTTLGVSVLVGGVLLLDSSGSVTPSVPDTLVMSYKANSFILAINGKIIVNFTSAIAVPLMTQLDIGTLLGNNALNGSIEYLTYYPKQLSLQEHRQLSSQ